MDRDEKMDLVREANERRLYHAAYAEDLLDSSKASDVSVDRKIKYATQASAHATLALLYQGHMQMLEPGPASSDA